jgi:two-component system LytT family response regulator
MLPQILKSIVVDDEAPSRQALVNFTHQNCPDVEIVAECDSIQTAYEAIEEHNPHLVFLDVEMPWGSGIELLKKFNPIPFKVIFITAFSEYAVQAFRFAATDFLLKPVKVVELVDAVAKVRKELSLSNSAQNLDVLLQNFDSTDICSKKLVIADSHGFAVVNTCDIIFCQADTYCTNFTLVDNQVMKSTHNLRYFEELLPIGQFMRVHNSYIVNIDHVKSYSNQGYIRMTDDHKCSVSTLRKPDFLKLFKNSRR